MCVVIEGIVDMKKPISPGHAESRFIPPFSLNLTARHARVKKESCEVTTPHTVFAAFIIISIIPDRSD